MTDTRNCDQCGKLYKRRINMIDKRWAASRYCGRTCAGKARGTNPFKEFFSYVDIDHNSQCWNWAGHIHKSGYGVYRSEFAHRFSLKQALGLIPDGMMALHACDNRKCVNPTHLFIGTGQTNVDDMFSKGRNRHLCGEQVSNAKLTAEDVIAIREDGRLYAEIAKSYNVSLSTISSIKTKRNWAHV